jgi:hypothetical protein
MKSPVEVQHRDNGVIVALLKGDIDMAQIPRI